MCGLARTDHPLVPTRAVLPNGLPRSAIPSPGSNLADKQQAGLIDTSDQERRTKKSQWAKRFDERNPQSTHLGQSLEEGEEGADYMPVSEAEREAAEHRRNEGLWTGEDETYYNEGE